MTWTVGDRVKHLTVPYWNLGEVVEVIDQDNLDVVFSGWGQRRVAASRLVRLTDEELAQLLPKRRTPKRAGRPSRSLDDYRGVFLTMFPKGFHDPKYVQKERDYKIAASERLHELLNKRTLTGLVKAGDFAEVSDRAKHVLDRTNLAYPNEKMDFKDGLKDPVLAETFARALLVLLYGPESIQARMEGFMGVLSQMGAAKWTIATYFPFLALPNDHLFIKPTPTKRIAEACLVELNYRPELNWLTYSCALQMATVLGERLADLKPRDMIDLQSFIWLVARD